VFCVKLPDRPGKFNAVLAKQLGVKGSQCSALIKGESVVTESGRLVKPEECVGEKRVGQTVVVVDCIEPRFIRSLVESHELDYLIGCKDVSVVHFSPRSVVIDPRYMEWCHRFWDEGCVKQYFIGNDIPSIGKPLESSIQLQDLIYKVDPLSSFPTHEYKCPEALSFVCPVKQNQTVNLLSPSSEQKPVTPTTDVVSTSPQEQPKMSDHFCVHVLGTGASMPSKYRNVSGYLLEDEKGDCILVDCGESTFYQMCQHFGEEVAFDIAQNRLKAVFLTHAHADHILGLPRILELRSELKSPSPLYVVSTSITHIFLSLWCKGSCFEHLIHPSLITLDRSVLLTKDFVPVPGCSIFAFAMPVEHSPESHAFVFNSLDKSWKVVFSGDCRPCLSPDPKTFDCDMLIHESTFDNGMEDDAQRKGHCTINQALTVAKLMKAKSVVLTHFSQRYSKAFPDSITEISLKSEIPVVAAFDHFVLKPSHMGVLSKEMSLFEKAIEEWEKERKEK